MQETLGLLAGGGSLSEAAAEETFCALLRGEFDEAQIGALLAMLASRGPTTDELVGAARAMRAFVTPVPVAQSARDGLVDTCGTGGAPKTFNISTGAAIVAAAAGAVAGSEPGGVHVRVAKHGNRSRTGRGSAEVLMQLGINVDASPETQATCLEEAGVCFCFAIHHHPAMRYAVGPRKSLGFPTIFNLLGPLTNPAGAERQLLGVYAEDKAALVAEALQRLGAARAIVAHGDDGMDEITSTTTTSMFHVERGSSVQRASLDPASLGLHAATLDDLRVETLEDAASVIRDVVGGTPGPAREIVELNAAAALHVGGAAATLEEGLERARAAIDAGAAKTTLELLSATSA
ncbi:MAG: anthranilate phosphoribosyltransferase [Planctomycetota bacterium]